MTVTDERTIEAVERYLELAKLNKDDLEETTQTLYFSHDLPSENIVLMEVNSKLLDELSAGKRWVLRGGENDTAIMCTDDATYEVREAATSNSILLVPELALPEKGSNLHTGLKLVHKQITGIHRTYLEPRECQPKLFKLRKMLDENPFKGPEYESDNRKSKYKMEDLQSLIQATESQLQKALSDIPTFVINGFYRTLDFDYYCRVVTFILDLVDSNSWPTDQVPRQETILTLEDLIPKEILEQCFDQLCQPNQNQSKEDLYELKVDKICRFHAEILLRNVGKFNRQEFLKAWQASVPEGMTTDMTYLKGIALEDLNTKPEVIFFYPVWQLPEDITSRLDSLFRAKEKWTYEEIEPYIQDLSSSALSVSAILTKYARSSTKNGIRLFSSKHPMKK